MRKKDWGNSGRTYVRMREGEGGRKENRTEEGRKKGRKKARTKYVTEGQSTCLACRVL